MTPEHAVIGPLLTVTDLAEILRTTPTGVRRMRQRGTLPPALKVGTRILWRQNDLDRWLEGSLEEPTQRGRQERGG